MLFVVTKKDTPYFFCIKQNTSPGHINKFFVSFKIFNAHIGTIEKTGKCQIKRHHTDVNILTVN